MIWTYHTTVEDVTTVYADTEEDAQSLEEWAKNKGVMPGSVCVVVGSGSRYIMNSKRQWIKQGGE